MRECENGLEINVIKIFCNFFCFLGTNIYQSALEKII